LGVWGEAEPKDLSGNLIVGLGVATEGLNWRWYETTGQTIPDVQRQVKIPALRGSGSAPWTVGSEVIPLACSGLSRQNRGLRPSELLARRGQACPVERTDCAIAPR
jgi:hypothetical protein